MLSLGCTRAFEREEMIGADGNMMLTRLSIIVGIKLVCDAYALGTLYEYKRNWIIGCSVNILITFATEIVDAKLFPVDGIFVATFAVLVAGNVDTIDTLRGVLHALAPEAVLLPLANLQSRFFAFGSKQLYAESVASVLNPVTLEITAIGYVGSVAVGCGACKVAKICANGIDAQSGFDGVGIKCRNNGISCGIYCQSRTLMDSIAPSAYVPYG